MKIPKLAQVSCRSKISAFLYIEMSLAHPSGKKLFSNYAKILFSQILEYTTSYRILYQITFYVLAQLSVKMQSNQCVSKIEKKA